MLTRFPSETEYNRQNDDLPANLQGNTDAAAYFGILRQKLPVELTIEAQTRACLEIETIVNNRKIVRWTHNRNIINGMKGAVDDYFFALKEGSDFDFPEEIIDEIVEAVIAVAVNREI